jgi:serine/threonine protein kinase
MSDEERLVELLERWAEARASGRPLTPDEVCADCPRLLPQFVQLCRFEQGRLCDQETSMGHGGESPGDTLTAPEVPGYTHLRLISAGGMGRVYQAWHVGLDRDVALKVIRPEKLSAEMRARFQAEGRAIAALDHPHIVQVFDVGVVPGTEGLPSPYLVMEFVPGGTLEDHAKKALPPAEAARVVQLLARAVAHAHSRGVVHRDLKPANVLIAPLAEEPALNAAVGRPKVTDFGLARREDGRAGLTRDGAVLGTPAYMAPEQADGRPAGPPADVYALGAILYRLLTGQPVFESDSLVDTLYHVRNTPPRPVRELAPDVPEGLEALCLECLNKQPERRPTAEQLAQQLSSFLAGCGHLTPAREWPAAQAPIPIREDGQRTTSGHLSPAAPRRLRWVVVSALIVLLAVSFVGGALLWPRGSPALEGVQDRQMVLRIWSPDESKRGLEIGRDVGALPAQPGDQIRVEVKLNTPAYIYLVALVAEGEVVPLYPWHKDATRLVHTLDDPPPLISPQAELVWPEGRGLRLNNKSGVETILLLARRTPWPQGRSLAEVAGPLPLGATPLREPLEFAVRGGDGEKAVDPLLSLDGNRGFGVDLDEIDEPLIKLMARLKDYFELRRAVRFAHQGKDKK